MIASPDLPGPTIEEAGFPNDTETLRRLFRTYQEWLGVDLCFQGFEQELAALPGAYARPSGNAWLARRGDETLGCVAVRPLAGPGVCEMKRLYLAEQARGMGLGARLADRAVAWAAAAGYSVMRLDTLRSMTAARVIYARIGFIETAPYYDNPMDDVVYLELDLARWRRLDQERP